MISTEERIRVEARKLERKANDLADQIQAQSKIERIQWGVIALTLIIAIAGVIL